MVLVSTERTPTIRDVAARAGVSKSLVSLVLRGDPGVSPARRDAVTRAVDELGYQPNRVAQVLGTRRSGTVGVLLNDLRNPWFVDLLAGATATLDTVGLAPVLVDSATSRRVGGSPVDQLLRQQVDGIVVVGTTEDEEELRRAATVVPIVLAGTYEPADLGPGSGTAVDVVVNDDVEGAVAATRHCTDLGHTAVTHLQGPGRVGELRLQGYRKAMTAAGLEPTAVPGGMSEESGYAAARRVLTGTRRPTAIVAYNDLAAIGALSAAHDLGLRVPEDVSVVGYDNTYLAMIRHVSLTSVENGTLAIGVQAARFLAERIDGQAHAPRVHQVPASLVVRRTTSSPPAS
ncbi:LacI family DNA-binding transcriptional regulator [Kineococcus endophyticus]|uniref:LacI family DNA-binding transcriptional regulator n=1 Tax=Kineococcus endophyticus TaxID=1181883 RepID=UPI003F5A6429